MNVYFENSEGNKRIIGENIPTHKDAYKCIKDFLDDHNFKSYYMRTWYDGDYTVVDVGSHTEFFLIDGNIMECNNNDLPL